MLNSYICIHIYVYINPTSEMSTFTVTHPFYPCKKAPIGRLLQSQGLRNFASCAHFCLYLCLLLTKCLRSADRVIQSSHPVCNTIMLVGVITCLSSVFLLGLDGRLVSAQIYPLVCQARVWFLSLGFTLSYGAMFSKVWRVHRLTTKAKSDTMVSDVITEV